MWAGPPIWRGEIPNCVHQNHILKVRVDREQADPEYVLEYMQTTPARIHFRSRAKFTTNLASINSTDLRDMPLALPPLRIQRHLAARMAKQRQKIKTMKTEADCKTEQAKVRSRSDDPRRTTWDSKIGETRRSNGLNH